MVPGRDEDAAKAHTLFQACRRYGIQRFVQAIPEQVVGQDNSGIRQVLRRDSGGLYRRMGDAGFWPVAANAITVSGVGILSRPARPLTMAMVAMP